MHQLTASPLKSLISQNTHLLFYLTIVNAVKILFYRNGLRRLTLSLINIMFIRMRFCAHFEMCLFLQKNVPIDYSHMTHPKNVPYKLKIAFWNVSYHFYTLMRRCRLFIRYYPHFAIILTQKGFCNIRINKEGHYE